MRGIGWFYRLKAIFGSGVLRIGRSTKVPFGTGIIWKHGDISIGERVHFRKGVVLDAQGGSIEVGKHVSFNEYSIVLGRGGVTIGNDVRIAAHAMIVSFDHNFDDLDRPIRLQGVTKKPIVVEDDVWIGAGAKILGGAHVSKGCVIGANAVVKGRTEPYGIYVGAPARLVRRRGETTGNELGNVELFAIPKK